MPSDHVQRRLQDIIDNISSIFRYTEGLALINFEENQMAYDAVERCLERISEAAAKLGELAPVLMPDQPCPKIRALGNRLRHEYDDVREERLFDIVKTDLPGLLAATEKAVRRES